MSRPWMPLYVGEYRRDTAHLSAAEHGAYLLLIMHYWSTGGLPDDDGQLARIACMKPNEWRKARAVVRPFFQDGWKHKRIEFELTEAARISAAGRIGGKASAEARRKTNDKATIVQRSLNDPPTNPQALQSPSQRKEDTADAVPPKYFFEAGVIRLVEKDFRKWESAFKNLDLAAELTGLSQWAGTQERWFHAVSGALAKRNREVGIRIAANNGRRSDFDNPQAGII